MEDILLSQKQYRALLKRLDEINEDVTSIKFKSQPEVGYIDNHDLLELLHVTNRTVQRWRKSGQLPYKRLGHRFYYRADVVLEMVKLRPDEKEEEDSQPPGAAPPAEVETQIMCERCPLFVILNS